MDHLILPLIALPAVWAVLFFHAVLDRRLARVAIVAPALGGTHAALLVHRLAAPVFSNEEAKP